MSDANFTKSDGTEVTPEMQRNAARKIGGLIRMSQDETLTPEARASYAAKAEELMREYRTAEEKVISSGFSSSTPVRYEVILLEGFGSYVNDFQHNYLRIWGEIRKHAGLVGHVEYAYDEERDGRKLVAVGYGYEIDIRLAEFLWTSAHLVFATRIDPKVDPKLSDQLNCYYLRGAGMQRNDIAEALWGSARNDGVAHGKVQKLYLAECEARGEKPAVMGRGIQVAKYREAYADAFVNQFGWRLREARDAADAKSGLPVLHGRKERIAEPYYAEFPDRRPATEEEKAKRRAEAEERLAQEEAAEANCVACAKTTSQTGKCKRHRPRYATEADYRRWERAANSPEKRAGERAGAAAASSVAFRRTATERAQATGPAAERRALS
jgi:hypothetical protein